MFRYTDDLENQSFYQLNQTVWIKAAITQLSNFHDILNSIQAVLDSQWPGWAIEGKLFPMAVNINLF